MTKKSVSLIVKLAVTIAILLFLFSRVDFSTHGLWFTLRSVRPVYYLLSLFGVIIVLGIKSYRWKLLVANEGYEYSARRAFGAYMASDAIGIVTPGRIGEIARLYYVRQETPISFFLAFKTIVSDRIFDFTMLGWFGLSGLLFYLKSFGQLPGYLYLLIILVAFVAAYVAGLAFLDMILHNKWLARWQIIGFVRECFRAVLNRNSILMWSLTIIAYAAYFFFSWLIMRSLNLDPGFEDVAFIMSIMSLSTIIPISVAGFGTREATLVILFSYYHLASETAVSFSILHFTAFFLWGGLIGLVYWLIMPISLKQVKEDSIQIFELFKPKPKANTIEK